MREVEVLVKVDWEINGNDIKQIFSFDDRPYVHSPSYILHEKFEDKIVENSISHWSGVLLTNMERRSSQIILEYKVGEKFNRDVLKPRYYKVVSTVPDYEGCDFCRYYKKKNGYATCEFQEDKILHNPKKSCRFFKQKKLIKT